MNDDFQLSLQKHLSKRRAERKTTNVDRVTLVQCVVQNVKINCQNVYSLLTAREVVTFATSFCRREGLATLRAPAAAFDTALRIMAGRVKRDGRNVFDDLDSYSGTRLAHAQQAHVVLERSLRGATLPFLVRRFH